MRKLNTKNKIYIWALSLTTLIAIILLIIFIIGKIKILTFKYVIEANSYTYDENRELLVINENVNLKRTLLNEYFILNDDNSKTVLYENPVIYNKDKRTVTLFGTFYEVLNDGDVKKLKNINEIKPSDTLRIFKITDRRYLVIANEIKDANDFKATDYLLIDLDTAGNAYLYNDVYNIKTFEVLKLIDKNITFNVNSEKIVFGEDTVDLAKINGSTNNYKDIVNNVNDSTGNGETVISNVIENNTTGNIDNNIYEESETNTTNTIKIAPKTTILEASSDITKIDINYLVFDPYNEYTDIYFTVEGDNYSQTFTLSKQDGSYSVNNLLPSSKYKLNFYYSYMDNDEKKSINFDSKEVTTKDVTGNISIEKVDGNIVQYKVKVDKINIEEEKDNYCDVVTYLNDTSVNVQANVGLASLMNGISLSSTVEYTKGSKITISLENCKYNDSDIKIDAKYKLKI